MSRPRGQETPNPAGPVPCVGPSPEPPVGYCGQLWPEDRGNERSGVPCQALGEGSEGLAPARGHQHQRRQTASWVQPHPDDAVVQSHRTVSLGGRGP